MHLTTFRFSLSHFCASKSPLLRAGKWIAQLDPVSGGEAKLQVRNASILPNYWFARSYCKPGRPGDTYLICFVVIQVTC